MKLKPCFSIKQPHIRAKIIGTILIVIGVVFLCNPTSLNIKIGFISIIVGIFAIFMITERNILNIPRKISTNREISNIQIEGNQYAIKKIIEELNLAGNAVFLPKSKILTEERILIPPNNLGTIKIPDMDDNRVFLTGANGKNLGISIPPSGLKLLKEIEKDGEFKSIKIKNMEKKLQIFVHMNLIKSLSFKKGKNDWKLELERPVFLTNDKKLRKQYPGPICSAILTAITRTSKKKLCIIDTTYNEEKITFHLQFLKRKN